MASNDDLMAYLKTMDNRAEKTARELRQEVTKKIENLARKVESAKNEAKEKEDRENLKMANMNKMILDLEKKMTLQNEKWERRMKEKDDQKERVQKFNEAVGLEVAVEDSPKRTKTWSELIKENKESEKNRREAAKESEKKHWNKQVKIRERVRRIEEGDIEEVVKVKKTELKKKDEDLKLDTTLSPDEDDWSWEESDRDWDGTEGKREEEKRKKLLRYRKKKLLVAKTARRAKHMIGIGPILKQSVGYFLDITSDLEEARKMAVNEFLMTYLQFTESELDNIMIVETMTAKTDEEIIYVTFRDHSTIRDIYGRTAEIRNDEIQTRIFVPPQFWDRYQVINQYCAEQRMKNKDLKTQIRFGDTDIEVMLKDRSKDEGYSVLDLKVIEVNGSIPKFNHEVQWRKRIERLPRNSLKTVSGKLIPPSIQRSGSSSSGSGSEVQPPKRQRKNKDDMEIEEGITDPLDVDLEDEI